MISVYLCGPINGCSDDEAMGWRERAKSIIRGRRVIKILDPMNRDYRFNETGYETEVVEADKADIASVDALIVNASRPSWGTAMEIAIAYGVGKQIFAYMSPVGRVSPWLKYHCNSISNSLGGAVGAFLEWAASVEKQPT